MNRVGAMKYLDFVFLLFIYFFFVFLEILITNRERQINCEILQVVHPDLITCSRHLKATTGTSVKLSLLDKEICSSHCQTETLTVHKNA